MSHGSAMSSSALASGHDEPAGGSSPANVLQPTTWLSDLAWSNTPENIALIGFALGALCFFGVSSALQSPLALHGQAFVDVLTSPAFGIYIAAWSVFHLLEYVVTAIYNPTQVNIDSYLLNNGRQYHLAHAVAVVEYFLSSMLLSPRLAQRKATLVPVGLAAIVVAQGLRSLAMATAAANFTHLIATRKREEHILVTSGIYGYMRHPSYVAFTYWALGTQLVLGNPVSFIGFALVLWKYFEARIRAEERYLVSFFGDSYVQYRARVPTRLPFIP